MEKYKYLIAFQFHLFYIKLKNGKNKVKISVKMNNLQISVSAKSHGNV